MAKKAASRFNITGNIEGGIINLGGEQTLNGPVNIDMRSQADSGSQTKNSEPVDPSLGGGAVVSLLPEEKSALLKFLIPLPMLKNEESRESVLISAELQSLIPQLNLAGPSAVVVPVMLNFIQQFGRVSYDQIALGRFLSTLTNYVGLEESDFLTGLIAKYNLLVPAAKAPTKIDWTVPTTPAMVLEKIIGENTLRPIAFLYKAIQASRSVAYVEAGSGSKRWSGTGFMVSRRLFMTNHHVLPSQALLPEAVLRFGYQMDVNGNPQIYQEYKFVQNGFFRANEGLDYAIVEVQGDPGAEDNWGSLKIRSTIPERESRVNIIQHPSGLPKQIAMQNNFVKYSDAQRFNTLPAPCQVHPAPRYLTTIGK
jgi:hypothetical protein